MPRGTPAHGYGGTRRAVLESLEAGPITTGELVARGFRYSSVDAVLRELVTLGVAQSRRLPKVGSGRKPHEYRLVQP